MELGRHIVIGRRRIGWITVSIALLEDEGENGMRPPGGGTELFWGVLFLTAFKGHWMPLLPLSCHCLIWKKEIIYHINLFVCKPYITISLLNLSIQPFPHLQKTLPTWNFAHSSGLLQWFFAPSHHSNIETSPLQCDRFPRGYQRP